MNAPVATRNGMWISFTKDSSAQVGGNQAV